MPTVAFTPSNHAIISDIHETTGADAAESRIRGEIEIVDLD